MRKPRVFPPPEHMRAVADRIARGAALMYFALVEGPRGRGRATAAEGWDAQWRRGDWDYLVSPDELPRYAVIAGYIRAVSPPTAVLDVGCGHGQLFTMLGAGAVAQYHGIDISGEAITKAQARYPDAATFEVADLTTWRSPSRFDVVVINEVLYYISDPVAAVARCRAMLNEGGMLVISMFRHANTRLIWRNLQRRFPLVDTAEVKNRLGEVIDIKIFRTG